jgi:hypothetical protein
LGRLNQKHATKIYLLLFYTLKLPLERVYIIVTREMYVDIYLLQNVTFNAQPPETALGRTVWTSPQKGTFGFPGRAGNPMKLPRKLVQKNEKIRLENADEIFKMMTRPSRDDQNRRNGNNLAI